MSFDISSVITIVGVIVIAVICYIMSRSVKKVLDDKKQSDNEVEAKSASIISETATAFETALKQSFNEAIADGVITKEEALKIVTASIAAVKTQFVKSMTTEINESTEKK